MLRPYATGCTWALDTCEDLVGAARRAEGVARVLGWTPAEAVILSRIVLELGGNAIRHGGGRGTCRLEAGEGGAEVVVEDRGPGFPEGMLSGPSSERPGGTPGGLDWVRRLSAQLVLENVPDGGGRARAVFPARHAVRPPRVLRAVGS